jgi:hypothetical protein
MTMALRREQEELYRKTLEEVRRQIDEIEEQIEEEIKNVRIKLADLQKAKKSLLSVYRGMAGLLGEEIEDVEDDDIATPAAPLGKVS